IALNQPNPNDPIDVLSKVGGFEIGGLAGIMLGAASHRIPVMLDGFISGAAALIAAGIAPEVTSYLIAGHRSAEPGHDALLKHLSLSPLLDLKMRLGEGTGAALAMFIAESSCRILREMATFEEAQVSQKMEDSKI
ncbi:MAG: nicotinate-nucleotide--dimethylbenzimidazole phosphoribosyltransferase, partial [Elusimicrobia bacterium]|nr:nicotinate-nucleotide--dimethylbenzimidazole phosphoribosyltransferase [Elusimicrobiota bacterium]